MTDELYRILGVPAPGEARRRFEGPADERRERTISVPVRSGATGSDDDVARPPPRDRPYAVSDRRWWARQEPAEAEAEAEATESAPRKPTQIERLEAELARKDELARKYAAAARAADDEIEAAKARIQRESARELARQRRTLIAGFLPVLDDFDRALEAARRERSQRARTGAGAGPSDDPVLHGMALVRERFLAVLRDHDVTHIDAAGARFDPTRHEAVTAVPAATPDEDGVVTAVARQGYMIGDDVLRPAQVVVARAG